jgi:hypothetical protein
MSIKLYTPSLNELLKWPKSPSPFAAWIHFDRDWSIEDVELTSHLIECGCRFFMITGRYGERANDQIDWLIPDVTRETVLTLVSAEINEQSVFEFLSTQCPGDKTTYRLISVLSSDPEEEKREADFIRRAIEMYLARPVSKPN